MIKLKKIPQNLHTTNQIHFSDDEKVMYQDHRLVMMKFEQPFMEAAAKVVTQNGGDILNVGFGMGMVDTEIQKYNPESHSIIEIHPDIHKKIILDGWDLKPNVNLYFGDWRDFIDEIPKMDGIYFDTLDDNEFYDFISIAWRLLKPNGIFSFFNNPKIDSTDDSLLIPPNYAELLYEFYDIELETISLSHCDIELQKKYCGYGGYWNENRKKYYSPILRPKKKYRI